MKEITKETFAQIDKSNMWDLITGFPDQIEDAAEISDSFEFTFPTEDTASIVLCGMGGSALIGDIVREYLEGELAIPFITIRGYSLPAFVNTHTLVFISSFSGDTDETLELYEKTKKRTSKIICITSGGELETRAVKNGIPVLKVPDRRPPTALGYMLVFLLRSLTHCNLIRDQEEDIEESILLLRKKLAVYKNYSDTGTNPPLALAHNLLGMTPIIYGSHGGIEAAAFRWKAQFNENSKIIAYHNTFPELCHNEYQGWYTDAKLTKPFYLIYLRDPGETDRIKQQVHIVRTELAKHLSGQKEYRAEGRSFLARLLYLIYLGDFTSYYLAILRDTDPTTISAIKELKNKMKKGL